MGFTNSNRYKIFTKRCAPLQVNFLGYAGTFGSENMDYIVDKFPNDMELGGKVRAYIHWLRGLLKDKPDV